MEIGLDGKGAWVTEASRGAGKTIALEFAKTGADQECSTLKITTFQSGEKSWNGYWMPMTTQPKRNY